MTPRYAINVPPRGNITNGVDRVLDMPRVSVWRSTLQTIATGTATGVQFNQVDYDTDGMFSVSNGFVFTCRTAGLYSYKGWALWDSNSTSFRKMQFIKTSGAVTTTYGNKLIQPSSATNTGHDCVADIPMVANDTVFLSVRQDTGGNLNVGLASATTRDNGFQACLISL